MTELVIPLLIVIGSICLWLIVGWLLARIGKIEQKHR